MRLCEIFDSCLSSWQAQVWLSESFSDGPQCGDVHDYREISSTGPSALVFFGKLFSLSVALFFFIYSLFLCICPSEQLSESTSDLPELWHWGQATGETEGHHQEAPGRLVFTDLMMKLYEYTIQYSFIQNNTIHYNTAQYNTVQYNAVQLRTKQYSTIHYSTASYKTIQHNAIQHNIIQYSTTQLSRVCLLSPAGLSDWRQDVQLPCGGSHPCQSGGGWVSLTLWIKRYLVARMFVLNVCLESELVY